MLLPKRILRQPSEVDVRLAEFGVTRDELIPIAQAVVAARADAVEDDPLSAEGLFAYIYGTRALRKVFRAQGWLRHRHDNVESVRHPEHPLTIVYQSVDRAADPLHEPKAISGKGAGTDRLIAAGQGDLFTAEELAPARAKLVEESQAGAWFFCVSVNGDDVRAEQSLPPGVENGNFGRFLQRIFILGEGDWMKIGMGRAPAPSAVEFEPTVVRKRT